MIDRLQAMRVFIRIVETRSFTRAADSFGLQRSTVTTIVQTLEASLRTQLLNRTTRSVNLTSEGAAYYERCVQILDDIEEMEATLRGSAKELSGHLGVQLPWSIFNALVSPALDEFHSLYPQVDLSIYVGHRDINHIAANIDCSVRLGALPDSKLVARYLGELEVLTCASPQYLMRRGMPSRIDELAQHVAVNCMWPPAERPNEFEFDVRGTRTNVQIGGFLRVNDEQACLSSALHGLGLIQSARVCVLPYLQSGALHEVLPEWKPTPRAVSAVYAQSRRGSLRTRAFIDWLVELFSRQAVADKKSSCTGQIVPDSWPASQQPA